jgi:hypothetical protein
MEVSPSQSVEVVTREAVWIADEVGLGVTAMALYRYGPGRYKLMLDRPG